MHPAGPARSRAPALPWFFFAFSHLPADPSEARSRSGMRRSATALPSRTRPTARSAPCPRRHLRDDGGHCGSGRCHGESLLGEKARTQPIYGSGVVASLFIPSAAPPSWLVPLRQSTYATSQVSGTTSRRLRSTSDPPGDVSALQAGKLESALAMERRRTEVGMVEQGAA